MSSSIDKWKQLENMLAGPFGYAKAVADGHEIIMKKVLYSKANEKLLVEVFVDGEICGKWTHAENGQPVNPEAWFWQPKRSRTWPLKKYKTLKNIYGKKKADDMTALKVIMFSPYWSSTVTLVRHLKKHFPDLDIL